MTLSVAAQFHRSVTFDSQSLVFLVSARVDGVLWPVVNVSSSLPSTSTTANADIGAYVVRIGLSSYTDAVTVSFTLALSTPQLTRSVASRSRGFVSTLCVDVTLHRFDTHVRAWTTVSIPLDSRAVDECMRIVSHRWVSHIICRAAGCPPYL